MQQEYMKDIDSSFEGMVRGVIPLFESDIRGVEKLDRVASLLF
jgi:anion-transporting  ArsA/GET3 family ATPase